MKAMTETVIKMVWGKVSKLGNTNEVAIAGGVISDHYFGLESRDIDVFIGKGAAESTLEFVKEHGFEAIAPEAIMTEREDSYGDIHRTRIGSKQDSEIINAWRGELYGVPVELILVTFEDITAYIAERFDQSIKAAWYNGKFHYTDSFMKTVKTGVIEPVRHEATGYVRAWLSAQKYGLVISPRYELSKQYTKLLQKDEELGTYLSKSTMSKIEGLESDMFNFKYNKANAMLMDLYLSHEKDSDEMYEKLLTIINKNVVTEHPAIGEYEVGIKHSHSHEFSKHLSRAYHGLQHGFSAAAKDLAPLMILTEEQFMNGKLKDSSGRDVRIGRQLNKIMRQHKEAFETMDISRGHLVDAIKVFETRSTSSKAKVFITGHKHALLNISTGTHWTSCQRWERGRGGNNYGLLANVSGSTLVAYVADERSDMKQKNWQARVLIRVGVDGSLFMERTYTDRSAFGGSVLSTALTESLRKAGFTVLVGEEETLDFKTKPMWSKPYNDMLETIVMKTTGGYVMRGKRREVEKEKRINELNTKVSEFLDGAEADFYRTGMTEWVAILELPKSLYRNAAWGMKNTDTFNGTINLRLVTGITRMRRDHREDIYVQLQEIEGKYYVIVKSYISRYKLTKTERDNNEHRLQVTPDGDSFSIPGVQMVRMARVRREVRLGLLGQAVAMQMDPFEEEDHPLAQFQLRDDADFPF